MLYVYINESGFRYEVEELIKLFIPWSDFEFIEQEEGIQNKSFLLSSFISYDKGNVGISSELTKDGKKIDYVSTPQVMDHCENVTRKEIKEGVKRSVFLILRRLYDYTPPWGILTGVRPTKIVNEMIEAKFSHEEIRKKLNGLYYIDSEKINLLFNVCNNEKDILSTGSVKEISLYIGIPFCPTKCTYCSFTSYPAQIDRMNQYLEALIQEIIFVGNELINTELKIETLYIGGGTPTALTVNQLNRLLIQARESFELNDLKEYTVECGRPDTITSEKLKIMKSFGVNRISINPQSMNEKTLVEIGRNHTPEEIKEAFYLARKYGFHNINMDLIAGLPNETPVDFNYSINALIQMEPENITVHTLAIKRASKLKKIREEYSYYIGEEAISDMLEISSSLLHQYSYEPYYMYRQKYMSGNYENVGYCKNATQCIYNIRIMEEKQTIIALGAGGISKVFYPLENRLERVPNVSNYEVYIERIQEMIERKKNLIFANIDNKISNTL